MGYPVKRYEATFEKDGEQVKTDIFAKTIKGAMTQAKKQVKENGWTLQTVFGPFPDGEGQPVNKQPVALNGGGHGLNIGFCPFQAAKIQPPLALNG